MERPDVKHVLNYLEAFYHGLPVKLLDDGFFTFCPDNPTGKKKTTKGIGLRARGSQEYTALRFRPTPNYPYSHQLNLDDLLDAAIASLPEDAYALLFLVNHDLYEDEEDEFCCGRAYGGSRVAVVSSARYCPRLDEEEGVEMGHAWPASCCAEYVGEMCGEGAKKKIVVKAKRKSRPSASAQNPILISDSDEDESDENKEQDEAGDMASIKSPMRAAISATQNLRSTASSPDQLTSLWLWRVTRTASHELGHVRFSYICHHSFYCLDFSRRDSSARLNSLTVFSFFSSLLSAPVSSDVLANNTPQCFGIDHCTCYACIMQGSAGVVEDARQPPYLCLVDEGKVGRACGGNRGQKGLGRWVRERLRVLGRFCEERGENGDVSWACYRGWIEKRLESMDGEGGGEL